MSEKVVYLMRGLPSCGKSTTALQLAGTMGIICETDSFFNRTLEDGSVRYAYKKEQLAEARRWNYERFQAAVRAGQTPVVVDRGNSRDAETQRYVVWAMEYGYRVELTEPQSPWWEMIRWLLALKPHSLPLLRHWADILAEKSLDTHRVSAKSIFHRMESWQSGLTVDQILGVESKSLAASG